MLIIPLLLTIVFCVFIGTTRSALTNSKTATGIINIEMPKTATITFTGDRYDLNGNEGLPDSRYW